MYSVCVLSIEIFPLKLADAPIPTVTNLPDGMGGVNVAAAVAIPVVLVLLLLLVIGVVIVSLYLYHTKRGM